MNQMQLNAVRTLAKKCIAEHKAINRKMTNQELKKMIAPYREKARLLGCDDLMFSYQMGLITGRIKER